jgi:hypothetical protein
LHLLPERFVKIRHFGFLSNRQRHRQVEQARAFLARCCRSARSPEQAEEIVSATRLRVCPFCGSDQLRLIQKVPPSRCPSGAGWDSS